MSGGTSPSRLAKQNSLTNDSAFARNLETLAWVRWPNYSGYSILRALQMQLANQTVGEEDEFEGSQGETASNCICNSFFCRPKKGKEAEAVVLVEVFLACDLSIES